MSQSSVLQSVISPRPPSTAFVRPSGSNTGEGAAVERIAEVEDMELITSALVENAPVAMAMFDRQMRYVLANRQWIADFGLKDALPLIGRSQFDVFPNLNPGWKTVYDRALQGHVVRSEHDVLPSGPGGRPMVFRWEVRPWRRTADATVMGIMVTCEKFTGVSLNRDETSAQDAITTVPLVPECGVPMLALDAGGHVWHANTQMSPLLAMTEGVDGGQPVVWEALLGSVASEETVRQWKDLLMNVIIGNTEASTLDPRWFTGPAATLQWTLCRLRHPEAESLAMLVGNSTPFALAAEPIQADVTAAFTSPIPTSPTATALAASSVELEQHANELSRELAELKELENTYRRREVRHREVLDTMPCGLIVLDERGRPIFQNAHVRDLVGHELGTGGSVEQWLMRACPDEAGAGQAATVWRDDIWRRQLTRVLSLSTTDGLVKDLEFRPSSLPQGGLLLTIHDVTDSCRLEEMLASVEAKFRTLLRECPLPLLLTDLKGSVCETNPEAEQLFGRSRPELRRLALEDLLAPESEERRRAEMAKTASAGFSQTTLPVELQQSAEGRTQADLRIAVIKGGDGRPHALAHYLMPRKAEAPPVKEPQAATLTPAAVFDVPPQALFPAEPVETWHTLLTTDELGRIQSWDSRLGGKRLGHADSEVIGMHLHRLFKPSDATGFYGTLQEIIAAGQDEPVRWPWFGAQGRRGEDEFQVRSLPEGGLAVELRLKDQSIPAPALASSVHADAQSTDLRVGSSDEPAVSTSAPVYVIAPGPSELWSGGDLKRERMLLTETHHRVKNHLQIISSLLNLQGNSVEDEATRALLRSSQNRVRAIAALHQHLYEMQLGHSLSLTDFAEELVVRLRECFEVGEDRVKVELNLSYPKIRDEWLMPIALILNEALSNAFKHAFPDARCGTIRASLSVEPDGAHLRVEDDGVGLPEGFGSPGTMGLGLKVLGVFADQMHGQTSLKNIIDHGLRFDLRFPITCVDI